MRLRLQTCRINQRCLPEYTTRTLSTHTLNGGAQCVCVCVCVCLNVNRGVLPPIGGVNNSLYPVTPSPFRVTSQYTG